MQTLELSYLILAGEFGLLACATLALMWFRQRKSAVVDEQGAKALETEVTGKEPTRREALQTIFAERYNIVAEELDAKVEEFIERERSFYETLLTVYVQRDPEGLSKMGDELNKVIAPWISMVPQGMVDGPTAQALQSNLSELNSRNETLSEELDRTKQVMEGLLGEYNAAFGHRAAEDTDDIQILSPDSPPAQTSAEEQGTPSANDEMEPELVIESEESSSGETPDAPPEEVPQHDETVVMSAIDDDARAPQEKIEPNNVGDNPDDGEELSPEDIDKLLEQAS